MQTTIALNCSSLKACAPRRAGPKPGRASLKVQAFKSSEGLSAPLSEEARASKAAAAQQAERASKGMFGFISRLGGAAPSGDVQERPEYFSASGNGSEALIPPAGELPRSPKGFAERMGLIREDANPKEEEVPPRAGKGAPEDALLEEWQKKGSASGKPKAQKAVAAKAKDDGPGNADAESKAKDVKDQERPIAEKFGDRGSEGWDEVKGTGQEKYQDEKKGIKKKGVDEARERAEELDDWTGAA